VNDRVKRPRRSRRCLASKPGSLTAASTAVTWSPPEESPVEVVLQLCGRL
jgi:hypothetical protein